MSDPYEHWVDSLDKYRAKELSPKERRELDDYFKDHPRAYREFQRINFELDKLVVADPPSLGARERQDSIQRALEESVKPLDRRSPSAYWLLAALVPVCGLLLWVVTGSLGSRASETELGDRAVTEQVGEAVIRAGAVTAERQRWNTGHAIPTDRLLEAGDEGASITLKDQSRVKAKAKARFKVSGISEEHLYVQAGSLNFSVTKRAPDHSFVVETDELRLRVIGTQFVVAREGTARRSTTVSVKEGVVETVSKLDGSVRRLTAGQQLTIPPAAPKLIPAGIATARDTDQKAAARTPRATRPKPPSVTDIRKHLHSGKVSLARELLREAESSGQVNRAELALLKAEAELAERHYGQAVKSYLAVVKYYPGTPQAEVALFAAAQLSSNRGGGLVLLQRYLDTYPEGRFKSDARRLLKALQPSGSDAR